MLKVHAVNAFQDNYIWLIQAEHSDRVLIVDPGDENPVLAYLAQHQLSPAAILITHHHADHVGGVEGLLAQHTIPVFGPAHEQIPAITHKLSESSGVVIDTDFPTFQIMDTPGHTGGHICYLVENKLFCGDTLFAGGCGRLLGGTATELFRSLERLKQLPEDTEIYCAHEYTQANLRFAKAVEPDNDKLTRRIEEVEFLRANQRPTVPSRLSEEINTNPFLRSHLTQIKKAAENYIGRSLDNAEKVFTVLRSWKNQF